MLLVVVLTISYATLAAPRFGVDLNEVSWKAFVIMLPVLALPIIGAFGSTRQFIRLLRRLRSDSLI